jgi:hypothetical protein
MRRCISGRRVSIALASLGAVVAAGPAAAAQDPPSIVHPIYAQMPDAPQNDVALRELTAAAGHYKLRPVEVVDIEPPPLPKTAAAIKAGMQLVQKLSFGDALKQLDVAANEIASTGGAGVSSAELSDLFLYRGMAAAKADWKPERSADEPARARAFEEYVRAATIAPERVLSDREYPPQVIEDWKKAIAEVQRRPKGTLVVRGSSRALIALDGRPPVSGASGGTFKDLPYGEHLVSVEEGGRASWGSTVLVNAATADVVIPARAALTLDDATAASHARRMGAKFALVGELKLNEGPPELQLRLVDVTGIRHDATVVPLTGEQGSIDAATMRLDEEARRIVHLGLAPGGGDGGGVTDAAPPGGAAAGNGTAPLVLTAPPPARPSLRDDPAGWTRDHWPLVAAVGAFVGASLVLGLTVALEGR